MKWIINGAIAFDKGSGAFVVTGRKKGAVSLHGGGTPAMWTYRALERAGYRVLPEGAAGVSVQVALENERPVWIVGGAIECCCASIEEMLGALNERLHKEQKEAFRG